MCINLLLQENFDYLTEIVLQGQNISLESCRFLCEGLAKNEHVTKIVLSSNSICDPESISYICAILVNNNTIQYLDLSDNHIDDLSVYEICENFTEFKIKTLILDYNYIRDAPIWSCIGQNEFIEEFSISFNPLTFEAISNILDSLVNNQTLKCLGILGMDLSGPAPIKENAKGYLSMQESIELKLAHVLRYSNLIAIAIDINPADKLALEELESTLVKHNRYLKQIISTTIDWENLESETPLIGISRALKANAWLSKNDKLPNYMQDELFGDIQDLVEAKLSARAASPDLRTLDPELFIRLDDNYQTSVPKTPQFTLQRHKFSSSSEEDDIIAQMYGKSPLHIQISDEEINDKSLTSISAFADSPKNITIENAETPNTDSPQETENIRRNDDAILRYFHSFTSTLERFESKLDELNHRIEGIESKTGKNLVERENRNSELSKDIEVLVSEVKNIKESTVLTSINAENIKSINEKLMIIENKDKNRGKLLEELGNDNVSLKENSKDLELKIDKIDLNLKNQLKSFKNTAMSRNEIAEIRESEASLSLNMENLTSDIYHVNEELTRLRSQLENQSKSSTKITKIRADQENWNNQIIMRLEQIEEREEE